MGVGDNLMVPLARLVGRIRVDHSISEVGQVMERLVAHLHGDRVGRYRILTLVADGGMAAVYLAALDGPSAFTKQRK